MTGYNRGQIVLVEFGFSEGHGSKRRPALIISSPPYHASRDEVIVAAITSNVRRPLLGDTKLAQWKAAGLLFPSIVTGIVRTVKAALITRTVGALVRSDLQDAHQRLKSALGF
jgi:mRNA-degrading endonuclease toxin of MazEF toxin-antitoxin module